MAAFCSVQSWLGSSAAHHLLLRKVKLLIKQGQVQPLSRPDRALSAAVLRACGMSTAGGCTALPKLLRCPLIALQPQRRIANNGPERSLAVEYLEDLVDVPSCNADVRRFAARRYVLQTYARAEDMVFVSGEGCRLYDARGKAYLDFAAGIAVNALGSPLTPSDERTNQSTSGLQSQSGHELEHTSRQPFLCLRDAVPSLQVTDSSGFSVATAFSHTHCCRADPRCTGRKPVVFVSAVWWSLEEL